ncbi:MAG TPA: alpha-1,4-glucan--maltose-1-phosphate maltosyltransferase [Acidobacteriota bacterium]
MSESKPLQPPPASAAPARVVIDWVEPEIDGGRFPIKRTVGESVEVRAALHADGHELLAALLRHRAASAPEWNQVRMRELGNDRWSAVFEIATLEPHEYTVEAWIDRFRTWRRGLKKKIEAEQDVSVELLIGAELVRQAGRRVPQQRAQDAAQLETWAAELGAKAGAIEPRIRLALDPRLEALVDRHAERRGLAQYGLILRVTVDRAKARCSAWYELFPRSCADDPKRHGTFKDLERRLPYIAGMGFDVLYLPPIHPIGRTNRKGRNNAEIAEPDDVGSPWAIGAIEGGHKSIHPQLGTLEDFKHLLARARDYRLEVALDLAFQCSADHPYVREHPEWFRSRPDGSIQYAENPPKKYQDIYPPDFECDAWRELWHELASVVQFWIDQGVRIFRVDNPHTKPYAFWEWLIGAAKQRYPELIFLSEAFTRPQVMVRLAKLGFTQSYTYFTWRNTKRELTDYLTELTQTEVREYFRPNLWPNTPDILPEHLQYGGRPAFIARLVLAATLGANYGIYGPAFELCENRALTPGREEYLDSEKYQLRHWNLDGEGSLKDIITRVNRARRENPALQTQRGLEFHSIDNDHLIAYSKCSPDQSNIVLVIVNLDFHNTQSGWLELPLEKLGLDPQQAFQVHELLGDGHFFWHGPRNYVQLDPHIMPAHIFRVRRRLRTERDFDYFL